MFFRKKEITANDVVNYIAGYDSKNLELFTEAVKCEQEKRKILNKIRNSSVESWFNGDNEDEN